MLTSESLIEHYHRIKRARQFRVILLMSYAHLHLDLIKTMENKN